MRVGAVLVDNFRLEGKDLVGVLGVHPNVHPVHVGTAEGLDAGEVLDPLTGSRGDHRLVHPEGSASVAAPTTASARPSPESKRTSRWARSPVASSPPGW